MEMMDVARARQEVAGLEELLTIRPTPEVIGHLAATYFALGNSAKALPMAEKAYQLSPANPVVVLNLGMVLRDLGRAEEAARYVYEAFLLDPTDLYVRMAYGEDLLRFGHWRQAWPIYDHSRPSQIASAVDIGVPSSVPEWNGQPLTDKQSLLVINEGGFGDRLMYPRFISMLKERGVNNWKFFPGHGKEPFSFYERIMPRANLVKTGDDIDWPSHWVTAFSMPAKMDIIPSQIPAPVPITADPEALKRFTLRRGDKWPVIGLCYSAAELFQGERKVRSMSEGQAMRLITSTADRVNWVNLQFNKPMPFPVSNIPFGTWEDTAALIHNLDAVVSVDTGVMHLAASMGKPTAILLSGNSCWKFMRDTNKCHWYPSARIFKNPDFGFETALSNLIMAIRNGEFPRLSN